MTISMIETVEDDIKTALNAETSFLQANFTFFSSENDEGEDVDFEYNVPNIIYGNESTPVEYFMDGTPIGEDEFLYRGMLGMNVTYLDATG